MINFNTYNIYTFQTSSGQRAYTLESTENPALYSNAIHLLDKLEEVVGKDLPYVPSSASYAKSFTNEEAIAILPQIAKLAQDHFMTHHAHDRWYRNKDWPRVKRFLNILAPTLPVPQETINHIGDRLNFRSLVAYSGVNVKAQRESQAIFENLAKLHGYTYCKENFALSISPIDYLKVLSCFKENAYKGDPSFKLLFLMAQKDTIRAIFRMETPLSFHSSLSLSEDKSLFALIGDGRRCNPKERAVLCSFAHSRPLPSLPGAQFLLGSNTSWVKQELTKAHL